MLDERERLREAEELLRLLSHYGRMGRRIGKPGRTGSCSSKAYLRRSW